MDNPPIRLLLALDGSAMSAEVLKYTAAIFPPDRTEAVLLHIASDIPEVFWDMGKQHEFQTRLTAIRSWAAEQHKDIEGFMEGARDTLISSGFAPNQVAVKVHKRRTGVTRDILKEAAGGYTAVVVGRTGRSRVKDVLLGSTAMRLIGKLTDLPLIVIGTAPVSNKVLVGYDGSTGAGKAVSAVGRLIGDSGCRITLCHVVRTLGVYQIGPAPYAFPITESEWHEARIAEIEPELSQARNELVSGGVSQEHVETKILSGETSRAAGLVHEASVGGYDTIVVGRRGLTGLEEYFAGRVSKKVFQLAGSKTVWIVN